MHILVINGPNINLLGIREPTIYGSRTFVDLIAFVQESATALGVAVTCFQSNHEGALVDCIQAALGTYDGIVINPAAYTHTSIAIFDALKAVNLPCVEVHLSDPFQREEFRRHSYISAACIQTVAGHGFDGYRQALLTLKEHHGHRA